MCFFGGVGDLFFIEKQKTKKSAGVVFSSLTTFSHPPTWHPAQFFPTPRTATEQHRKVVSLLSSTTQSGLVFRYVTYILPSTAARALDEGCLQAAEPRLPPRRASAASMLVFSCS